MTAFDPVSAAFNLGAQIIERLWPDPEQANEAKLKLLELQQTGELAKLQATTELAKGQLEINKTEAQHVSVFVAGWRPMVGWACTGGLIYSFILKPIMGWVLLLNGVPTPLPGIEIIELIALLGGLLGLGTMRTAEKINGVARNSL